MPTAATTSTAKATRYAIVHMRHGEVEAVFVCDDGFEAAAEKAFAYAVRSGFFVRPMQSEFRETVEFELRSLLGTSAQPPLDDEIVLKRVFTL